VHTGRKIFYVIQPSAENLQLFASHLTNPKKSETFFADLLPANQMFRVAVEESEVGQLALTFIIPLKQGYTSSSDASHSQRLDTCSLYANRLSSLWRELPPLE